MEKRYPSYLHSGLSQSVFSMFMLSKIIGMTYTGFWVIYDLQNKVSF